jgi:hypothetical protein
MKLIRLTYAMSTGPAVIVDSFWPSTWDALEMAYEMGARVACAKVMS